MWARVYIGARFQTAYIGFGQRRAEFDIGFTQGLWGFDVGLPGVARSNNPKP